MTQARILKLAFAALVAVAVAVGGTLVWGVFRWGAQTHILHERLDAARTTPAPSRFDARELEGLPAPVQRYFRAVLTDDDA